uniref:sorting nexin-33-like n=1 Tax=Myxine glutinosa TaxID=7769 RepID=UPI00358F43C3
MKSSAHPVSRAAKVLYDFHSENPAEISIHENERVAVLNDAVGDGWVEGTNSRGERGLFPATYVEFLGRHTAETPRLADDQEDWDADWDDSSSTTESSVYGGGNGLPYGGGDTCGALGDKNQIVEGLRGPEWQENPVPFTCSVEEPTKQTKFKGMKSFIAYRLTPSFSQVSVSRRYKQFDWLQTRLQHKFPVLSVPQLPEKQATGRFEDEFVRKRRRGLVLWTCYLTSHPVLSRSDAFQHFITCTDDRAWKLGKRRAERDQVVGPNAYLCFAPPSGSHLDLDDVESRTDSFRTFAKKMDDGVSLLGTVASELARRHASDYRRDLTRLGSVCESLSQAFELDERRGPDALSRALAATGAAYVALGEMWAQQAQHDMYPLLDVGALYQGLLANFPEIIQAQKSALVKVRESQKASDEGKMELAQLAALRSRTNILSLATQAEFNHFQNMRVQDFRRIMQVFLQAQIAFHQAITRRLQEALSMYEDI